MWAIGCDKAGTEMAALVRAELERRGLQVFDAGTVLDYTEAADAVASRVSDGRAEGGVLICGTGIGMSMMANRYPGVRAALCHDVFSAKATRLHNDANILTMGARVIGPCLAEEILKAFLDTPFSGEERHIRRIAAIHERDRK